MCRGKKRARRFDLLLDGGGSPTPADREFFPLLRTAEGFREIGGRVEPRRYFAKTLEDRVLREAAELRKAGANASEHSLKRTAAQDAPPEREWDVNRRRRLFWQLAAVAMVLFSLGAALVLASEATADSPLYGLRRLERTVQLQLAFDPDARAQVRVAIAQDSQRALQSAIAQRPRNPTGVRAALSEYQADYQSASDAVAAINAPSQRAELEAALTATRTQAIADLRGALIHMDWPDRLAATAALSAFGEETPVITQVTYTNSAGGLAIHISGARFAPGAKLYLDGRPAGRVDTVTSSEIEASLPGAAALAPDAKVGVGEPDGTAVEFTVAAGG